LYLGWGLAFWAIPTMTVGHLLFAGFFTAYMMLAAIVEERDLVNHFGQTYKDYRRRVPMFVPRLTVTATASQAMRESEQVAQPVETGACEI
jgi:methanethiol S-methyltransferase